MQARTILVVGLLLGLASPTALWAQKVKTDFDPAVDFAKFTTYYWAKSDPSPNDLMNQRLISAVDHWLTIKGWTRAAQGQAQLAVVPVFTSAEQKSINTFYDSFGGGWGYGGWGGYGGMGMGSSTTTVSTFVEGTLIVDLFDASTKKLVWRAIATDTLSDTPAKNAEKIQKATKKMFEKKFPPAAKKTS
jgi:hypothetical protein